jgi:hypothetical protein
MGILRLFLRRPGAIIFAVTTLLLVPSGVRADCSADDILNALQGTFQTITSSNCAGVSSDPTLWAPVGTAAAVMAGVPQSAQFCQDVQNAQNQLTNVQGDGSSLVSQLNNMGIDASFLSTALDALGSASDALSVVLCSCALSNNITQLGGDVGDCVEGALCDLQNWANSVDPSAFGACTGKVVMQPTNCTQNPCQNGNCDPNLGNNVIARCSAGADAPPVTVTSSSSGTIVTVTDGADADGNISVQQCICPAPMQVQWDQGTSQILGDPQDCQYFMCVCPPGSTPAGTTGSAQYVCICGNTHQPAQPPIKTTTNPDGIACPVPLTGLPCPNGQTRTQGQCVQTCAPNQILLGNGSCCNPAQASACGTCCPNGQSPDAATGNCAPTTQLPRPGPPSRLR